MSEIKPGDLVPTTTFSINASNPDLPLFHLDVSDGGMSADSGTWRSIFERWLAVMDRGDPECAPVPPDPYRIERLDRHVGLWLGSRMGRAVFNSDEARALAYALLRCANEIPMETEPVLPQAAQDGDDGA